MPRTFLSFLGAIPYHETAYVLDRPGAEASDPTPYVLTYLLPQVWSPPQPDDQVLLFVTPEARHNNFAGRLLTFRPWEYRPDQGLAQGLQQLVEAGHIANFEAIDIPNGYAEKEFWTIFQRVFERLRPGEEVFLDITSGFRTLPLLGMVLLNYAKALQDIQVKGIFYGNYEAGRAAQTEGAGGPVQAPVLDLLAFSQLQDWTYAARSFLFAGNARPLAELVRPTRPDIGEQLLGFTEAIATCRGYALSEELDIHTLKQIVQVDQPSQPLAAQLEPLVARIADRLTPFQQQDLMNGLVAVEWCIRHDLIQQGYTLLQESLIGLVVQLAGGQHTDDRHRNFANAALNGIKKPERISPRKNAPQNEAELALAQQMVNLSQARPELIQAYKKMTGKGGLRNDINHGGFFPKAASPAQLRQRLRELYEEIMGLLRG